MINNILHIVAAVIELSNILLCYTQIMQAQITKEKRKVCFAYIGIVLCNVINILCQMKMNPTLINMLCSLLTTLLVMNSKKGKWVLLYPCAFMISSIMNVTISFLMAIILNVSQAEVANNIGLALTANAFFSVVMIIIYLMNRIRKTQAKITLFFSDKVYWATTIGAIAFYLLIGLIQYIGSVYQIPNIQVNLLGFFLSFIGIMFFLFILWLSATIYRKETIQNEKNMLNLYLSEQEKYIQLIFDKDKDMRTFRHDVKEHMHIISRCIEQKDYDSAKIHIDEMNDSFSKAQMVHYTGITAMDVIVSEKKNYMDGMGIQFICEINAMKLPGHLAVYDVCTLLMNILNNAIEACEHLEGVDKVIKLIVEVDRDKLYIFEKNNVHGKIEFDKEGKPITTKEDNINHGLGSKNIRSIVEKYGGEIKYTIENHDFIIEIFM